MSDKTRVVTGEVRLSYANLWNPRAGMNGGKAKYSAMLIIPKDDKKTLLAIKNAIESAYAESKDALKGSARTAPSLGAIKTPLRDGDEEYPDREEMAGAMFLNASNTYPVSIYDEDGEDITGNLDRSDEIYSGVYARASIEFYAYNKSGNKGIAVSLRAVKKVRDGESLGSTRDTSHDFD